MHRAFALGLETTLHTELILTMRPTLSRHHLGCQTTNYAKWGHKIHLEHVLDIAVERLDPGRQPVDSRVIHKDINRLFERLQVGIYGGIG